MPSLLPLISTPTFAVIYNDNDDENFSLFWNLSHFLDTEGIGFVDQEDNHTAPEVEAYILQISFYSTCPCLSDKVSSHVWQSFGATVSGTLKY